MVSVSGAGQLAGVSSTGCHFTSSGPKRQTDEVRKTTAFFRQLLNTKIPNHCLNTALSVSGFFSKYCGIVLQHEDVAELTEEGRFLPLTDD